jgi:hypothetical protein
LRRVYNEFIIATGLLGKQVEFQNEGVGKIVEETDDAIRIESDFYIGWMAKAGYSDLLGVED